MILDVEEIRSIGLPDHQQKVTRFVVSSMLASFFLLSFIVGAPKFSEGSASPARPHFLGLWRELTIPPSCVQKFLVWPLSSQGNRGASVPLFRWPPRIWDRRGSRRGSSESYTRPRACCIQSGAELYPPGTEDDFKLQTANSKGGSSSGQTCEVDIGKKWLSTQHQTIKKQVTCNPLERNVTKNTAQPWWIAPETTKEMESCLEKIDLGVSRKRRHWATQQKAEVN